MENEIQSIEKKVDGQLAEHRAAAPMAMAVIPRNIKETYELATILSKSGIVPKEMQNNPAAAFLAISYGLELNISPTQALTNIMVVNNRASIWGDLAKAIVLGAKVRVLDKNGNSVEVPLLEEFDEDKPDVALAQGFGRCRTKRRGFPATETRFSMEDAARAGLKTKSGPWQQYTGRMLQMRSRSWELRDNFPDVLKGLLIREEVEDYKILNPEPVEMPRARVDASKVVEADIVSKPVENAPSVKTDAVADNPGDAIEPENDPKSPIDEETRKKLFWELNEARIPLSDFKDYLKSINIMSTATLNWAMLDQVKTWISENSKA